MGDSISSVQRLYYIDWIRVMAFGLLILFHCAMPFVTLGWEIKNQEQSVMLTRLILWLHQWRLPLLFFIAGVGSSFSLKRRTWYGFLGERFVRLFIPLFFAMMVTIPFQVYFEWLQTEKLQPGYWDFYPSVWEFVPYPDGSFTWSHLWFVAYLFVFTLLMFPLFLILRVPFITRVKGKLNFIFKSPLTLLIMAIPFMLYFNSFYIRWAGGLGSLVEDWFNFFFSITLFFYGFFVADLPAFWETCEKYRWHFLGLAAIGMIVLFIGFYWDLQLPSKKQADGLLIYGVADSIQIWSIIVAALGFARKNLNFSNDFLRYATPAVYPYYILHQTIIVASGYYVVQWDLPILLKLLVLIVICFVSLYLMYEYLIKRFIITRILYGLKPKR